MFFFNDNVGYEKEKNTLYISKHNAVSLNDKIMEFKLKMMSRMWWEKKDHSRRNCNSKIYNRVTDSAVQICFQSYELITVD